jgi:TPR repeat protein
MNNIGVHYANGLGVPQDHTVARGWFEKAAAAGEINATRSLGIFYALGHGVPQDFNKSYQWFTLAAEKGDAESVSNIGWMYANGKGVAQDYAAARTWYERAATKGDATAMVNLGSLYAHGRGGPNDYDKAQHWYERADKAGDTKASKLIMYLPITKAYNAGKYEEALKLQQENTTKTEAWETEYDGAAGEETGKEVHEIAWLALFARKPELALTSSERAMKLLQADLKPATNRAHALMYLGRAQEARSAFMAPKNKTMSADDPFLWQEVISQDFKKLRQAGLDHPQMREIEAELGILVPK